MVWSAEPGIDLFDERGRLIRAAEESMFIAFYGGLEKTYPGFTNVLSRRYAREISTQYDHSLVGTMRAHILTATDTDTGFKATICTQRSHIASRLRDGDYRISNHAGSENYIQFDRATGDPPSRNTDLNRNTSSTTESAAEPQSPAPDEPHWQAPTDDLFTDSGWTVTFGSDLGESMHRCEDWGRSIEPNLHSTPDFYVTDTPPPTLPAYPGW